MCGRFTQTLPSEVLRHFFPDLFIPDDLEPSYNIAPSQNVGTIFFEDKKRFDFFLMRTGASNLKPVSQENRYPKSGGHHVLDASCCGRRQH